MAAGKKLFLSQFARDLRAFISFSRQKKVEESMSGAPGVLNYAGCFSKAAGSVDGVSSGHPILERILSN